MNAFFFNGFIPALFAKLIYTNQIKISIPTRKEQALATTAITIITPRYKSACKPTRTIKTTAVWINQQPFENSNFSRAQSLSLEQRKIKLSLQDVNVRQLAMKKRACALSNSLLWFGRRYNTRIRMRILYTRIQQAVTLSLGVLESVLK